MENLTFEMDNDERLDGGFVAKDPDGSIFWYEITAFPIGGTLTQYGGRKRKFSDVPREGFVGRDSVIFRAIDDKNASGKTGTYVFDVLPPLAVAKSDSLLPNSFRLLQNYPNPFNLTCFFRCFCSDGV